jgi:predicted HTH domain antitoxin
MDTAHITTKHFDTEAHDPKPTPAKRLLLGINMGPAAEHALLAAFRKLRRAEATPLVVPPALLEHGLVTKRRAAKLLGFTPREVERRTSRDGWVDSDQRIPALKNGMLPISEVRRAFERQHAAKIEKLAGDVATAATGRRWSPPHESAYFLNDDGLKLRDCVSLEKAAEVLGLSMAAINRLAKDESQDGLFVRQHQRVRGWQVTTAELEAYQRKLAARRAQGNRSTPRRRAA